MYLQRSNLLQQSFRTCQEVTLDFMPSCKQTPYLCVAASTSHNLWTQQIRHKLQTGMKDEMKCLPLMLWTCWRISPITSNKWFDRLVSLCTSADVLLTESSLVSEIWVFCSSRSAITLSNISTLKRLFEDKFRTIFKASSVCRGTFSIISRWYRCHRMLRSIKKGCADACDQLQKSITYKNWNSSFL